MSDLPPNNAQGPDEHTTPSFRAELAGSSPPPDIPGYDMGKQLGRGGKGTVYQAIARGSQNTVAIKVIDSRETPPARFRREVEAVTAVDHPNIVKILESGDHEGTPFLVLEYVDGVTLADFLDHTAQPEESAATCLAALADAVAHCHKCGIVHRDIKPGNILVPNGQADQPLARLRQAKITDFGLAALADADEQLTGSGQLLGTPKYMAPEQVSAGDGTLDTQATHTPGVDIYQLGVILYEMLTGNVPFPTSNRLQLMEQIRNKRPRRPSHDRVLNRHLEAICLKCLQKEPSHRYKSAGALGEDLQRFLRGERVNAKRPSALWEWYDDFRSGLDAVWVLIFVALASGLFSACFHFLRAGLPAVGIRLPLPVMFVVVFGGYGAISSIGLITAWLSRPANGAAAVRAGLAVALGNAFLLSPVSAWLFGTHASVRHARQEIMSLEESHQRPLGERAAEQADEDSSRIIGNLVWNLLGGISLGLLWALLVGSAMLVLGTIRAQNLLQQKAPLPAVLILYLGSMWPLTLLIARVGDTMLAAPMFCGLFSRAHFGYIGISIVACAALALASALAWLPIGQWIGRRWHFALVLISAAAWVPAYYWVFEYARTEVYSHFSFN